MVESNTGCVARAIIKAHASLIPDGHEDDGNLIKEIQKYIEELLGDREGWFLSPLTPNATSRLTIRLEVPCQDEKEAAMALAQAVSKCRLRFRNDACIKYL